MKKVKMLKSGRWCDHPKDPILDLKKDQIVELSDGTADYAVNSDRAEYYLGEEDAVKAKELSGSEGAIASMLGLDAKTLADAEAKADAEANAMLGVDSDTLAKLKVVKVNADAKAKAKSKRKK